MTLPEIDHVSFLVEHAQTFFAGEMEELLSFAQVALTFCLLRAIACLP